MKRAPLEVLTREFPSISSDYFAKAIELGNIKLNAEPITADTRFAMHDVLEHSFHSHEPPVSNLPIELLHLDSELVVAQKPPSVPVHPCGRFYWNSLTKILAEENAIADCHMVHRLDRLVSGLVIMPRTSALAAHFAKLFALGKVRKEYVAKVVGKFPDQPVEVDKPIMVLRAPSVSRVVFDEETGESAEASATIAEFGDGSDSNSSGSSGSAAAPQVAAGAARRPAKASRTLFYKLAYDPVSDTSVVCCVPLTGRTHQIRVHLNSIGFPIANDPIYCTQFAARPVVHSHEIHVSNYCAEHVDASCDRCTRRPMMAVRHEALWLHASVYEGDGWRFESHPPDWYRPPQQQQHSAATAAAQFAATANSSPSASSSFSFTAAAASATAVEQGDGISRRPLKQVPPTLPTRVPLAAAAAASSGTTARGRRRTP